MKKVSALATPALTGAPVLAGAIVAVSSTKGGAGKSTTVAHLGMEAARKGLRTLVIDCDEAQTSIYDWANALREDPAPVVRLGTYDSLPARIAEGQREGFDLILVDCPPGADRLVSRAANLAEHILVPVRVTAFDLHALRHTVDLLQAASDVSAPPELRRMNALEKAVLVLNALPADADQAFMDDVYGAIIACGAGDIEIIGNLCERRAYATTLAKGLGVTEHRRDAKAAAEIEALFANLQERIESRRAEVVRSSSKEAAAKKPPKAMQASVRRKGSAAR